MIRKLIYLKKTSLALLIAFLGMSELSSAQYMEFEWSDEYRYTNRKTGFFSGFIGTSHSSIYLLQRNISKAKPYEKAKLMLVALNKNSLTQDTILPLKGFPENENQAETLNSLDYLTSVVSEGRIFVFWRKLINTDSTRHEEIYAQTFKSDLKSDLPLKKVFEFVQKVGSQSSIFDPSMCVIASNKEMDVFVLGTEHFEEGEIEFQYITLNAQLASSVLKTIPLPQKLKKIPGRITSAYDLQNNGNLFIRSTIEYSREELWELPSIQAKTFPSLTVAKIETAEYSNLKMQGESKTITDFSYQQLGGKTRVIGFFGDLIKDTTGVDNQGVFYADIDDITLSATDLNYDYFERSTSNRLFPKKRRRKKNEEAPSQEEILQTRFDIEHIELMPDSSMVLFFTRVYSHEEKTSRSNLNGENVYTTQSFSKKNDLSALRFAEKGKVVWARSVDRKALYEGSNVTDISVVYRYGKFIVLYGDENADLKPPRRGKKYRHLTEELAYATFDPNSGRAKVLATDVNEPKTIKKDKRYLDPNSAVVIDGQFYFHKMRVRLNPLWTAANVIFFPTIYYSVLSGNTKLGKADFATMRVMEGKRPRKGR